MGPASASMQETNANAKKSIASTTTKINEFTSNNNINTTTTANNNNQSTKTSLEKKWDKATEDVERYFKKIHTIAEKNDNDGSKSNNKQNNEKLNQEVGVIDNNNDDSKNMYFSPESALRSTKNTIDTIIQEMDHIEKYYELQHQNKKKQILSSPLEEKLDDKSSISNNTNEVIKNSNLNSETNILKNG